MTDSTERGAVLQFEIDRERSDGFGRDSELVTGSARWKYTNLLIQALRDTLQNGGTFVVVSTNDRVTAVQRPDAEDVL